MRHRTSLSVLVAALAVAALACSKLTQPPAPEPMEVQAKAEPAAEAKPEPKPEPKPEAPAAEPEGKLEKNDLVAGKGAEAKDGDTVKVHYRGTLLNGEEFDASRNRGEPFEFTLGQGRVIKGWDQGVPGMKVGGKRKLTIPSHLGYGARGAGPKIPPNSTLVFEVELLEIVKK